MKWLAITVIIILALATAGGGYFLGQYITELDEAEAEIVTLEGNVSSLEGDVSSLEGDVSTLEGDVAVLEKELADSEAELSSTKQTLASTQSDLTTTKQTLASTQQQMAIAQETLEGLGITLSASKECYDVVLTDNPTAKNPTWSQLMAFLSQDQTEKHTYIEEVYDCSQFSRDVHDNAEAAGIRAAVVHVKFRNEVWGHALNAFLTSDYGLVYVDCTEAPDRIAHVKAGKEYRAVDLFRITRANIRNDYWWDTLSAYYYMPSSFSSPWSTQGTVTSSIEIYW